MSDFGRFAMFSPKAVTGVYEMTLDDNCILHTVGATNRAVTLPKVGQVKGKVVFIQKIDTGAGATVLTAASGDTIGDASATFVNLTARWNSRLLMSDGTNRWIVLSTT